MADQHAVQLGLTEREQVSPSILKIAATSQKVDELLQRNRIAIGKHHHQINQANDRIRSTQAFLEATRSAQANVQRMPEAPPLSDRQAL
ncbi:hypothetical protein [Paenibacillus methanolicus]|uniref:Uncharacterized protein n=1 Tax=Paenibacillus methanolicus TaxID=582686 RepID=A0A5S5C7P7_9BACL|nr:hypothetical protein [Paenibacillus methanolicus]TYP74013.1 hypothetical protein BCM02_106294 [Paenibacillus methanolicus]